MTNAERCLLGVANDPPDFESRFHELTTEVRANESACAGDYNRTLAQYTQ